MGKTGPNKKSCGSANPPPRGLVFLPVTTEEQMPIQSPEQLLLHELHGIEDAESEASRVLESQMEEVENPQLQKLLERRLQQGERLMQEVQKSLEKLNG